MDQPRSSTVSVAATSDGTDIRADTWIDRLAPAPARPYLKLMRLDRPIGWWLLVFPCWWGLALAPRPDGFVWTDAWYAVLFLIGAVVMRGAGCTVNDMIDRKIDARVARTRTRPIASGAISMRQAFMFLAAQMAIGLLVLIQFNWTTIWLAIASLVLVFPYPLMKRITWWPQAFLGITFNWGALVGWTAVTGTLGWPSAVLYAAAAAWTIAYDTIYAHQDKEDDARIGVKSTALKFGEASKPLIALFYAIAFAGIAAAGLMAGLSPIFLVFLAGGAALLLVRLYRWRPDDPGDCLARFKEQRWFAWAVLAGFVLGRL